ncbi:MAG: Phospholipase [Pedosphaera sp.]|nr:Phospholipase [Pedosphaera sp.]
MTNPNLNQIKTIVIVMMENRSFDHMLGYLSLPPYNRADVDGQSTDAAWVARFTNFDQGQSATPFLSNNPYTLPEGFDPPHERGNVSNQIGTLQNGVYPMNGFVSALPGKVATDPDVRRLVMAYFGAKEAPMNHFLATNFAICDKWFCSLPAGTQPNRLMAMSGLSMIEVNQVPLPRQELVYDWLNRHGVSWRVYHQGIPFFTMMPHWIPEILLNDHFRSFGDLEKDLVNTPPDQRPQVIFIEPVYGDSPHLGRSTDDHAPAGVSDGQEFLMQVYQSVTASPSFWKNSVLIIFDDEHGGFFDHVSPPMIPTDPPLGANYPQFASLGVRIPGYVVSPFVKPGSVSHALLDHTSVLKLIGERFGNGSYSPLVDARPVESVSAVLDFQNPVFDPPSVPALNSYLAQRPPAPSGATVPVPNTPLQQAFNRAVTDLQQNGAGPAHKKFGPLLQQMAEMPSSGNLSTAAI